MFARKGGRAATHLGDRNLPVLHLHVVRVPKLLLELVAELLIVHLVLLLVPARVDGDPVVVASEASWRGVARRGA